MSKKPNPQTSAALVAELDQLVHMLNGGPELQQELPLPQEQEDQRGLFESDNKPAKSAFVPVLTSIYDTDPATAEAAQLDALIEELIEELMPRFETLLRARLKTRLKSPKK